MEEAASSGPSQAGARLFSHRWPDWALLAILVVLAGVLHLWMIAHAAVGARDSIGYIRYALEFERKPWTQVVEEQKQHPLYPVAVLAASWPVRALCGETSPDSMLLSAQLANLVAGILLAVAMFYLGKELFDRHVGFWAALWFLCLPVAIQVTSDGLSDCLFLLFSVCALLQASRALRTGSPLRFGLCGLSGGLAYLTRPEGALLVVATGAVLLGMQLMPSRRLTWRKALAGAACLALAAVLTAAPYVAATGRLTNKTTPGMILDCSTDEGGDELASSRPRAAVRRPLAVLLADFCSDELGWRALLKELIQCGHYFVCPLGWLGVLWFRERLRQPGVWVLLTLSVLLAVVLWRMTVVAGYVSERHVLILVLCCSFWAAALVSRLGCWLAVRLLAECRRPLAELALLLIVISLGLPSALKPMHASRLGHREAGRWLAAHADPADIIVDPFLWAQYYAGRVYRDGISPKVPAGYCRLRYVVLDEGGSAHSHLTLIGHARKVAEKGTLVFHWRSPQPDRQPGVKVYAVPSRRHGRPAVKSDPESTRRSGPSGRSPRNNTAAGSPRPFL